MSRSRRVDSIAMVFAGCFYGGGGVANKFAVLHLDVVLRCGVHKPVACVSRWSLEPTALVFSGVGASAAAARRTLSPRTTLRRRMEFVRPGEPYLPLILIR